MRLRVPGRAVIAAVSLVVLAAVVLVAVRPFGGGASGPFAEAVTTLPATVSRVSFTDWTAVDRAADGTGIDAATPTSRTEGFLDRAYEAGLIATSSLVDSFEALGAAYGVVPAQATWEIYGQGSDGSVAVLRLADDVDLTALEGSFQTLGYAAPPAGPGHDGTWVGSAELVARLDQPLTPLQKNVAVVRDRHLLVMSDAADYLDAAVAGLGGDGTTLDAVSGVADLVAAVGAPVLATLWAGDFACQDLAMSQASPDEAQLAEDLVAKAGGVHAVTGLVFAQQGDDSVRVVFDYADADQAAADLQPRVDLASGDALGQGGTFAERFSISHAAADGPVVTLDLAPTDGPFLEDLGSGPVLFATC